MIPGANLLNMAFGLISRQKTALSRFTGMTVNPARQQSPAWAEPVDCFGSFQPANMDLVQTLGLDMTRKYATFYTDVEPPLQCLEVDRPGDRVAFGGEVWEAQTVTDWTTQDRWRAVLMVRITDAA